MRLPLASYPDASSPDRPVPAEPLETLPSAEALEALLARLLSRRRRQGEPTSLLWIEFELLTPLDPALGGVEVVARAFGARLRHRVRRTDGVFEVTGQGFAVLLNADKAEAGIVEQRLREQLRGPYGLDGGQVRVQVSLGLAVLSEAQRQGSSLLQCAMDDVYLPRPPRANAAAT